MSTGRLLVSPQTAKYLTFTFCPSHWVFNQKTFAFRIDNYAGFAVVQSSLHDRWSRKYAGSRGETLSYTVSTAFDTFPFPESWRADRALEDAGATYYEFRTELMTRNDEGLTKTCNRFHDPAERDPDIVRFRELHAAMDRAVLDAYGWTDIPADCEFLLDYEIDEETWGKKKKPYRYRWPEEVHDDVLARLLDLNQRRYAEEVAAGLHAEKGTKGSGSNKKKTQRQAALPSSNVTLPLD